MSKNTQIPEEAIDRKAKIGNNETIVVAINPLFICSLGVTKAAKADTRMITDSKERILCTELEEGVTIKVSEAVTPQNRREVVQKIKDVTSEDIEQSK